MSHVFMVIINNSTSAADFFCCSHVKSLNMIELVSRVAHKNMLGNQMPWSLYSEIVRDSISIQNWVARGGEKTIDCLIYFNENKTILIEYDPFRMGTDKQEVSEHSKRMAEHWMNRMEMTCQTYINLCRFLRQLSLNPIEIF